ncbi:hypothetical protein E0Z10_g1039 [Xylaria hypoxylon]|uniref:BTB domain-containing protein n=1 Tax=Xylaria hypoxylon TaxID=37992 RepID=A0A4Z0Z9R5_9PEZI|nr:hypothetical protein E0Z10_g1039 [Xylaria hypoxylon]
MEVHYKMEERNPTPVDSTKFVMIESSDTQVTVHAPLLAYHSQHFRRILNNLPLGKETHSVRIDKPFHGDVLQLFVDWVYMKSAEQVLEDKSNGIASKYRHSVFVQAWVFGDYIHAPIFQNDVAFYIMWANTGSFDWIKDMEAQWDYVPRGSTLESLLMNMVCETLIESYPDEVKEHLNQLPLDIAQKVIHLLVQGIQGQSAQSNPLEIRGGEFKWDIGKFEKYRLKEEHEV